MKDVLRTNKCLKLYKVKRKKLGEDIVNFDLLSNPFIKEWNYWMLVRNDFPYDKIAKEHDLLVPKRKFANEDEMEDLELNELYDIKAELKDTYSAYLINTGWGRTVPTHFHIHCIKFHYITPLKEFS